MKKVFLLMAPGFELLEVSAPADVLERCGILVKKIAFEGQYHDDDFEGGAYMMVPSSHDITMMTDSTVENEYDLEDIISEGADMIILPGGYPGYVNLGSNPLVEKLVRHFYEDGKYIAAICGAPSALAKFRIGKGHRMTCHSSVKDEMESKGYEITGKTVETDGKIITGRGAGVSIEFAFECAKALVGEDVIAEVKRKMEIL